MQVWDLSIAELAHHYRRGTLSPVEFVGTLLDRVQAVDPSVRAWELLDSDGALVAAAESERELGKDANTTKPLLGVPFGVKDVVLTSGLRTASGSPLFSDFVPTYDATVVARLKAAGAVVLGKTITTQFAFVDPVPTRNPWDLERSPGYSSSGSVAAVSARMVPAAIGTQTGGSTVRPAAYCGVVGLKPTFGRIGRRGVMPLSWSLDDVGLIARNVEDVALLLGAGAGANADDLTASRRAIGDYARELRRPPRLGLLLDSLEAVDAVVQQHSAEVAVRLQAAGAVVRERTSSVRLSTLFAIQQVTLASEAAAVHGSSLHERPDAYLPLLRAFVEAGQVIPASVYLHAQRLRRRARADVRELFAHVDCLMLPAQPAEAPAFGTDVDALLQAPWTLLGLPAMTLPSGLSPNGLPLGTQLVAPRFREDRLLAVARWIERVLGQLPAPPIAQASQADAIELASSRVS
jgi:aspartyl-tRNA(Asn)/glutamyl-tRNA(Gln) amidotransferase subunit A